jgi:hypothetical protein
MNLRRGVVVRTLTQARNVPMAKAPTLEITANRIELIVTCQVDGLVNGEMNGCRDQSPWPARFPTRKAENAIMSGGSRNRTKRTTNSATRSSLDVTLLRCAVRVAYMA